MNMIRLWRPKSDWGHTVLAIWLMATGLLPLLGVTVPYLGHLLAILAVAAGVLILMHR
jgi:hypothetical protein